MDKIANSSAGQKFMDKWKPIKQFFAELWDGVIGIFTSAMDKILGIVDGIKNIGSFVSNKASEVGKDISTFFGFGPDKTAKNTKTPDLTGKTAAVNVAPNIIKDRSAANEDEFSGQLFRGTIPQIVSPQERIARQIDEQRTTSSAEITITDETGRAEKTSGEFGKGVTLQRSGEF